MSYRSKVYSKHVYSAGQCSPWFLKYIYEVIKLQVIEKKCSLRTCLPKNSVGALPRYITAHCGAESSQQ